MKNLFIVIFLFVGFNLFGQIPGYQKRQVREQLISFIVDSTLHVPRYNGTPSGVRVGGYVADGAIAIDTLNHRGYIYSGGAWVRMANYTELSTGSRFGAEDGSAGSMRYFSGADTYRMRLDSLTDLYLSSTDSLVLNLRSTSAKLYIPNIPYNSGSEIVALGIDTLTNRIVRKTASASTPTLQQVLTAGNTYTYSGSGNGIGGTNSSNGNGISITNSSNGNGYYVLNSGTGYGKYIQNSGAGVGVIIAGTGTSNSNAGLQIAQSTGPSIYTTYQSAQLGTELSLFRSEFSPSGAVSDGIGTKTTFAIKTSSGFDTTVKLVAGWQTVDHLNRTSFYDIRGVDTATAETMMRVLPDYVIVNNGLDTLARMSYVRDNETGGASYTAENAQDDVFNAVTFNLPLRGVYNDGANTYTGSIDTAQATANSLVTHGILKKKIDSLEAIGWGNIYSVNSEFNYQHYWDIAGASTASTEVLYTAASGAGSAITRPGTGFDNWFGMVQFATGTTSTGFAYGHFGNSGVIMDINLNTSYRYNVGTKIRLEDLSDGTETYHFMFGFSDANNNDASTVDGAWFSYTHSASSGQFVCNTRNNSVSTTTASGTTVSADTDYELEISVFGGSAYFYINKVLVATIATNVPAGTTRATSIATAIRKSAGTTSRNMYIEWLAYGKKRN